jgi:molybdenum cofactor cytidylyltransferase
MRTFAVIPAAGKSRRMGRPKLALPFGDTTVLQAVIAALKAGGVEHVVVVVGPHVPELVGLAEAAGAAALLLATETADMRQTVEEGLRWLEAMFHPAAEDGWLLVPGDHPTVDAAVVQALLRAYEDQPAASLLVPTLAGQRGHPTLFAWRHVAAIRRLPQEQGLNSYLRCHAEVLLEVPVKSSSILHDLDTPADYARLQDRAL